MGSLTLRHIHGRHRICTVNIMDFDYVNGMPSSTTRVFANTALILGFAFQLMGANYGMSWSVAAFPNGTPMDKAAILFSIFATISGLLAIVPMIMGIVSSKRVVLVTGLAMLFQMIHMALVSADRGASGVVSTLTRTGHLPRKIGEYNSLRDCILAKKGEEEKDTALFVVTNTYSCKQPNSNGPVLLMMTMTSRRRRAVDGADVLAALEKGAGSAAVVTDNTWSLALGWLAFSALLLCTVLRIMEKRN